MATTPGPAATTPPASMVTPAGGTPSAGTTGTPLPPAAVRRARGPRVPPPTRVAYTRHATAGDSDDRIVNPVWYKFLVVMVGVGGGAVLLLILLGGLMLGLLGGFFSGRAATASQPPAPIAAPASPPPAPIVVVPQPQSATRQSQSIWDLPENK